MKDLCSFNGDKCKELQDQLNSLISTLNSPLERERTLKNQTSHLISQDLYMEAFSRSENIKFFFIPEEQDEDTGEKLITNF